MGDFRISLVERNVEVWKITSKKIILRREIEEKKKKVLGSFETEERNEH